MPAPRPLSRAPITEALIDLRVEADPAMTLASLESFCTAVADRYPSRQPRADWSAEVQFSPDGPTLRSTVGGTTGFLMRSADGRQVVQGRLDGFTFSRMRPYQSWDALREDARRLWTTYCANLQLRRVTRVAVRYINRIELLKPVGRLDQYFVTRPETGDEVPQDVSGLFMRLVMPVAQPRATAIVTLASQPEEGDRQPFLLDIDVFVEQPFDPNDTEIWQLLDLLRGVKNSIFFGSITERALGMFS